MNISPVLPFMPANSFTGNIQERKPTSISYPPPALTEDVFVKANSTKNAVTFTGSQSQDEFSDGKTIDRTGVDENGEACFDDDADIQIEPIEIPMFHESEIPHTNSTKADGLLVNGSRAVPDAKGDVQIHPAKEIEGNVPIAEDVNDIKPPVLTAEKKYSLINSLVAIYNQIDPEEDDEHTIKAKEKIALIPAKEALKQASQHDLQEVNKARARFLAMGPSNYDEDAYDMTYEEANEKQEKYISELEERIKELETLVQAITEDLA